MTTTPTPEEFLALTDPEDDVDEPVQLDPLQSIAESLRAIAAACTAVVTVPAALADPHQQTQAESEAQERYDRLDQEYADLEDKHRSLYELLADVEKLIKPSTSKLANSVREAINRWRNPEVPAVVEPEPTPAEGQGRAPQEQPAHDADVEEWRAYAREEGYGDGYQVDTLNRSQIRSLLGIEQPVEDPA